MNYIKKITGCIIIIAFAMAFVACDDNESYADLLNDENKSVNYFLANHKVVNEIPEDSVFETGVDAPYYRLDADGNIYMQVLKTGDLNNKATEDQLIYFRFMRYNLNTYAAGTEPEGEGNANDMEYAPTSFRFMNYTLSSSAQFGSGVQMPLYYLGIDCEVNLIIKSQYGFESEISNVIPYLYNIRYFKSQI